MSRVLLSLACTVVCAASAHGQARAADPVDLLLQRLEQTLNPADESAFRALFDDSAPPEDVARYGEQLLVPDAVRVVVRERDRAQLEGVPEGEGYRLVVEFFIERAGRARLLTTGLDMRRPAEGDVASWRFVGGEGLTSVDGLYRLRLNTAQPYTARGLEITSEDLRLTLHDGTVFLVDSDEGVTGLVLLGRGEMRFAPRPETERGQLRIFSGSEILDSPFEYAYVRLSPADYHERVTTDRMTPAAADRRTLGRAQDIFSRESPKSFSLDLQDLSRDTWHLLPPRYDFLAEIRTRRHDTLTYVLSSAQAEDVSLFQRQARRTIALYASVAKLEARGRFYSEDLLRDYDVLDYNIEASISPDRQFIQGRARLALRIRSTNLSTLMLRLAEPLAVTGISSVEYGRLLHLRIRNQNTILINLPRIPAQESDLTLIVSYAGRLASQDLDIDTVQVASPPGDQSDFLNGRTEPTLLWSNRSFWYPQNPVSDYATATLRITVPDGYGCVASGEPVAGDELVTLRDLVTLPRGKAFTFRAAQPLRYLAVVVSRFTRVAERTIVVGGEDGQEATTGSRLVVAAEANSRQQQGRARQLLDVAEDVIGFYASLVGEAPYASSTLAMVESELPGGHSPGYFVLINEPIPGSTQTWRNDPASFDGFPEFFLAHELAHQWWGQAVGWKNYHEQWLSEGFSQYFAALYAQKVRGDRVFNDMLRQFRRWAMADSDQGPVHLGYRLGHIKGDLRVFRAVVYNKGAAVLHMLRRLVGDEVFFNALRRFYEDRKHQKAGTDDLERAFEAESGRVLDRFFERWIYGTDLPRLAHGSTIGETEVTVRFEQIGDLIFDLPVTVTLVYADGRTLDVILPVTEKHVEHRIPTDGPVRQVQINRDSAALANFVES